MKKGDLSDLAPLEASTYEVEMTAYSLYDLFSIVIFLGVPSHSLGALGGFANNNHDATKNNNTCNNNNDCKICIIES